MGGCVQEKFALARKLAHNDKSVRDEALDLVKQWLKRRKDLSEQDLLKLWKALYYCMWMSDKPIIQHELAQNIADILLVLPPERGAPFLHAFFQTMAREWAGTDHLRLDKFLALIRKMMTSIFKLILSHEHITQTAVCDSFVTVLKSAIFVKSKKDTRGIAIHIADVFVDELEVALETVPQDHDADAFRVVESLLKLLISVFSTKGLDKILYKRLQAAVFERIVHDVEAVVVAEDNDDVQVSNLTTIILMNVSTLVDVTFEAASDPESADRCRAPLYELRKRFINLQAQVEVALMDSSSDSDGEAAPCIMEDEAGHCDSVPNECFEDHDNGSGNVSSAEVLTNVAAQADAESALTSDFVTACSVTESETVNSNDVNSNVSADNVTMKAEVTEPAIDVVEENPVADVSATESGRRRRRRKLAQTESIRSDVVSEFPLVKRSKSSGAGGSAAPATPQSGDFAAGTTTKTSPPPPKSVHFSATKSVRRFNKKAPMKVATPARELISKKPQCSALRSRQ